MNYIESEEKIHELQKLLKSASYVCPAVPPVEEDGIYSSTVRAAVILFQQDTGLPVTGEADSATMRSLRRAAAAAEEFRSPPEGIQPFFPNSLILSVGSSGTAVKMLQIMLTELARRFDNISLPEENGIYGPLTAKAVSDILAACGMPPDGTADIFTWNMTVRLFNAFIRAEK